MRCAVCNVGYECSSVLTTHLILNFLSLHVCEISQNLFFPSLPHDRCKAWALAKRGNWEKSLF